MDGPATFQTLPNELLDSIFIRLESSQPFVSRLRASPSDVAIHHHSRQPLKAVSCVCKRWRDVVKPRLFRRIIWSVDRPLLQCLESKVDRQAAIPPLRFVHENGLVPFVDSFTIVVADLPMPRGRPNDIILSDFSHEKHLTYDTDMNWLWATVLEDIDPLRLTLVASAKTLAWLFSRMVLLADDWCFNVSPHVISMSRQDRQRPMSFIPPLQDSSDSGSDSTNSNGSLISHSSMTSYLSRRTLRRTPCNLFTMRPWTSILLNEGSNTEVYRIYQYSMKRPPSILGALLGCEEHPNNSPLLPHSVRDLSYICTLPVPSHWNVLIRFLPHIERFYFRVSGPGSGSSSRFAPDMESMENVLRRNDLYISLMRAAFGKKRSNGNRSSNWEYLKEIESGDTSSEQAMDLMQNHLRSQRESRGWCLPRPGFFVRDESVPLPLSEDEDNHTNGWSESESD